jgi:thymidylate kinase
MVCGLALRRLRPLLFAWRCRGLTVALLAPDGAGKTTLARQLAGEEAFRAKMIYMGENVESRTVGLPATRWVAQKVLSLNGDRKSLRGVMWRGLNFANRLAEHWFRSGAAQYHRLRGRFVIFDRYPYDSLLQKSDPRLWKRLRRWLFDVVNAEPDLVILLDAPPELLQQRKREHTLEWHVEQRAGYLRLRERLPRMQIVDAAREQAEVRRTATSLIWNQYRTRFRETHEAGR